MLVFFRRRWNEFPGDGFRYVDKFQYVSHRTPVGPGATRFVLRRVRVLPPAATPQGLPVLDASEADDSPPYDPQGQVDAREQVLRTIKARRGQQGPVMP